MDSPLYKKHFIGTKWVKWHHEGDPTFKTEGFMCDYHFRVAAACNMIERYGLGSAPSDNKRDCFFCRLPDTEV